MTETAVHEVSVQPELGVLALPGSLLRSRERQQLVTRPPHPEPISAPMVPYRTPPSYPALIDKTVPLVSLRILDS